jgi:5'-3' exoribonuclease 1
MSALALSKITSSLHMISRSHDQKINIGLCLKFESKSKKVLGYTRKSDRGWEFSDKAIKLIKEYAVCNERSLMNYNS